VPTKKKAEKEKEKTFSNKSIATITEQPFTVNLLMAPNNDMNHHTPDKTTD